MKIESPQSASRRRASIKQERAEQAIFFERCLEEILTDLARILVSSGFGVSRLSKLAKRAYVDAALELESVAGHRTNYARIAAATGLTRLEVSHLLKANKGSAAQAFLGPTSRAQRVTKAWINDSHYCSVKGKPNVLPFAGGKGSFEMLVKRYGGDIPAKAMLSEMLRLGLVRQHTKGQVRLVRIEAPIARQTTNRLRALAPWTKFLAQVDEEDLSELNANVVRISLQFETMPQLFAAVRELQSRATAFIASAHELSGAKKRRGFHKLDVSFALGTRVSSGSDAIQRKPDNIG